MSTILVTGGAGFIGSSLLESLLATDATTVVNVDKLTYAGMEDSLTGVAADPRYHFEQVDIADKAAIKRIFNHYRPTRVFHLAAESFVDRSIDSAEVFVNTNVVGTYVLLQQCLEFWLSLGEPERESFRFIHVSTDEVYGELPHPDDGNLDEIERKQLLAQGFVEDTAYAPNSPYSASKAASDHFVRAWHKTYGLPTITTNCSNNYGPRQLPEKLIPRFILNAISGQPLPVFGAGNQIRDWLHVQDHVEALLRLAEGGQVGHNYNIGGNNQMRNLEVIEAVCSTLEILAPDKPEGVGQYRELITHVGDRPGHDRRYAIDNSKITRELGWTPGNSFDQGLHSTVAWYLGNTQWWQRALTRMAK